MNTINIKGKEYQYVNHKGDYKLLKENNQYFIFNGEEEVKKINNKSTDWLKFIKTL